MGRLSYILGSACLLVVITLSFVQPPEEAVGAPSADHCDPGYVAKQEPPPPWEYNGPEIITEVQIKSSQGCFKLTTSNPNDGCYQAIGLGTTHVRVFRSGEASPECQAISHVYFYADQEEPTPTPTDTATPTNTATPTETTTPIATDPIVTLTPTETHTPTVTDTPVTPPPTEPSPGDTPTSPAPEATPTTPPTIPPPTIPAGTPTPQILIPVTGADQATSGPDSGNSYWLFLYLGLGLLGIGMVFHGITTRISWKK
jgi:hypothetical protein